MEKNLVYVIDDEKDICELIKITLESRGMKVQCEHNGIKGLEMLRNKKPDLVITDIKMPSMNGYEFINNIKKDPSLQNLPIMVITSLTQESKKDNEYWKSALEVKEFITKPFNPIDLAKKVEFLLNN